MFVDRYILTALLLGAVIGGFRWAVVIVRLWVRRWLPLEHMLTGTVMTGWTASECLMLDSFTWLRAL